MTSKKQFEAIAKRYGHDVKNRSYAESDIQAACVTWFRLQYPKLSMLLFAVPNGASVEKQESIRLKREGLTSGVSDLLLLVPNSKYNGLAIEMKTDTGKVSKNQFAFGLAVEEMGYLFCVCRSLKEFQELVTAYLE